MPLKREERNEKECSCSMEKTQNWVPLPEGWFKVNVDASHYKQKVALAFAIRDHKGKLLFLSTTTTPCMTPFLIELKDLEWAINYVAMCAWNKVLQAVDAQNLVPDILA